MSKLSSKPKISERKVRTETSIVEGDFNYMLYRMHGYNKQRVEGGWEYFYGSHWEFVDDEVEEKEIVEDEGGCLDLSNREMESLGEIIKWFSNNELDQIIKMDLSNNKIENLEELYRFKNLKELNLGSNNISEINNPESFSHIDHVIVVNNPIANNTKLPINFTRTEIATCDRCDAIISHEYVNEDDDSLCESCLDEYGEELKERIPPSKAFQEALSGPSKGGCIVTLVIMTLTVSFSVFHFFTFFLIFL